MKQKRNTFVPTMVILVLAFIFYTIIDSAVKFGHISAFGAIGAGMVLFLIVVAIFRFALTFHEYLIVGDELVIRRRTKFCPRKVISYRFDNIKSIAGRSTLPPGIKHYNFCNTIWATLFGGMVMIYKNRETGTEECVIVELQGEIIRALRMNLGTRVKL